MGLRDWWFKRRLVRENVNLNNARTKNNEIVPGSTQAAVKRFLLAVTGKRVSLVKDREILVAPEYDLNEIRIASESDSYIKVALSKYSSLVYKAGYKLKSENEQAVSYIKSRFLLMGFITHKPIDILFQEISDDLITYSNAFLLKARSNDINIKGYPESGVYDPKPIAGYYRLNPCHVYIQLDRKGEIKEYVYREGREEQVFSPVDVVHFYMDRKPDCLYGSPRICAALEDVKLLRRIEGEVLALIYRFSSPMYHYKVGIPENGLNASDAEINKLQREIEGMAGDGSLVTNERVEIKILGAEGNAINARPYLDYFEKRVFAALGVSESQMGRGGNKYDSESMEAQAHDTIKYIQRIMSTFIENYLLLELLLEGGFNPIFNPDDHIDYEFNEISLETRIKLENHEMLKYQSNLASFTETRRMIGKNVKDIDRSDFYNQVVTIPTVKAEIDAKADAEIRVNKAAQSSSGGGSGQGNGATQTHDTHVKKATSTLNRPSNQHGVGSAKMKENVDLIEKSANNVNEIRQKYENIFSVYENICKNIVIHISDADIVLPVGRDELLNKIALYIQTESQDGICDAIQNISGSSYVAVTHNVNLSELNGSVKNLVTSLFTDIKSGIKEGSVQQDVVAIFDKYKYRLDFMAAHMLSKAYWYSYIKTAEYYGIEKVRVIFHSEQDRNAHEEIIETKKATLENIPAFHPFCQCSLQLIKPEAEREKK